MKSEQNEIITTKLVMTTVILAIVKIAILILLFQDLGPHCKFKGGYKFKITVGAKDLIIQAKK